MEEEQAHIIKDSNYMESQEDDEEEALSLCDLPLNRNSRTPSLDDTSFKKILRPDGSEIFNGFSSSSSSDMCPADDIIFCGKLVPFKVEQPLKNLIVEESKSSTRRRRSESLSSVTRSNSVSTCTSSRRVMMRNSKSLDYSRLREPSAPEVDRNSSSRSVGASSEAAAKKAMKPRWYSLMFGTMKVPPEMELSDMKNRQVRRNPSTTLFPGTDSGGKMVVNRSSGKVSWRILKALSCKDHSSVAVTTSFALPQAS
ncbi:uncharacterized protein LOC113874750 [Abrus precatorius]|uniref:Uncharacterized protein LOC113874750 n=1 Tax=Abrus precatorius TaxID=3816 RepID=A0A8B8MJK0_ABRPR|nr:uncharacterized protein LOC113874750 [Abrus precatorius]